MAPFTVREVTRRLEPLTPDPFIDGLPALVTAGGPDARGGPPRPAPVARGTRPRRGVSLSRPSWRG
jgi:hypothetical protein